MVEFKLFSLFCFFYLLNYNIFSIDLFQILFAGLVKVIWLLKVVLIKRDICDITEAIDNSRNKLFDVLFGIVFRRRN
jgi:hypothetical protein